MAEKTTSAPRKRAPAKKRTGPTKAAALKALGLTQDDLDTLKAVAQAREDAKVSPNGDTPDPEITEKTKAQFDAKVKAYDALVAAGIPVPADLATEVESITAEDNTAPVIPNALKSAEERKEEAKNQEQALFIRNLRGTDFGFRLSRQQTGKRTDLKPRGQRGDIVRLEKEDYGDPQLERQIQYGCVEVITLAEAKDAIAKQAQNQQQAVHPAMAMLRNELDQPYHPDAIRVAPEFNSQGVTVAHLDPAQMQGKLTDKQVAGGAGMTRVEAGQPSGLPVHAPLGGNPAIINDGFARNDSAAARDAVARQRGLEGPAAGGIQRVVVEAPQKG